MHMRAGLTVTVYAPAGQLAFTTASALHHEAWFGSQDARARLPENTVADPCCTVAATLVCPVLQSYQTPQWVTLAVLGSVNCELPVWLHADELKLVKISVSAARPRGTRRRKENNAITTRDMANPLQESYPKTPRRSSIF